LPPQSPSDAILGLVGNFGGGIIDHLQLATSTDGNFLLAWDERGAFDDGSGTQIFIAHFTSRSRTWGRVQLLVPRAPPQDPNGLRFAAFFVRLHRIGSDAGGNALVLWTEGLTERNVTRTALKAIRVDHAGAVCSAVQLIDGAVGGGAGGADLGVDPQGNAIAIWQQFEGGRAGDLSRTNIAINRFDTATGTWASAVLAEAEPGNAISPRASANGSQALLGWIQEEGGANRVKALLQPLTSMPGR
jgi:hypothetical protein